MEIKAAALYMPEIHVGEPEKNRENLEKVIRKCFDKNPGIDIAVAPELANVGFNLNYLTEDKDDKEKNEILSPLLEMIPGGETVKLLENLAKKYETHLVCGIGERDENGLRYNSAVFISPDGFEGVYRQEYHFLGGSSWITGFGQKDQNHIYMLKGKTNVGVLICADVTYDGLMIPTSKRSSIIAIVANWYEEENGPEHWRFDWNIKEAGKKFKIPLVVGNRGKEYLRGNVLEMAHKGYSAILIIPGKDPIIKQETIVEFIPVK